MRIKQSDPRYIFIRDAAHEFVSREFNSIPAILFEKACELAHNNGGEADDVLTLVDAPSCACPHCGEEVEKGEEIVCNCEDDCECDLDATDIAYEGNHHWKCESCNNDSITEEIAYEHLPPYGPVHAWPGAWSTGFWTTNSRVREKASECGFLVYEPQDFNGIVLFVDGAGYDFYDQHWIPLYLALGYTWHEQAEGWQEACKKRDRQLRHKLNS